MNRKSTNGFHLFTIHDSRFTIDAPEVRSKKRLRCYQQVIAAQPLIPINRRSDLGDWQLRMYTRGLPFYIPNSAPAVGALSVGTRCAFTLSGALPCGCAVPLGFCCGGFSSTSGYDTGNEAQACGLSDCATSRPIISSKHDVFLSTSLTASLSASA